MRRPFLLGSVLDVLAEVPSRFRADKNLYISMVARFFPEVAAVPPRSAASLPNWSRDIREKPELRRVFLDLLDEGSLGGALGAVLDLTAVEALKRKFFDSRVGGGHQAAAPNPLMRYLPMRLKRVAPPASGSLR